MRIRKYRVRTALTPQMYTFIKKEANDMGMTLSEYLRAMVWERLKQKIDSGRFVLPPGRPLAEPGYFE